MKKKKYIRNQWFISKHNIILGFVFVQFFQQSYPLMCTPLHYFYSAKFRYLRCLTHFLNSSKYKMDEMRNFGLRENEIIKITKFFIYFLDSIFQRKTIQIRKKTNSWVRNHLIFLGVCFPFEA